jgi:hypothetical protein
MRQEDAEFEVSLGYIVSSRPSWATLSQNKTKQNKCLWIFGKDLLISNLFYTKVIGSSLPPGFIITRQ